MDVIIRLITLRETLKDEFYFAAEFSAVQVEVQVTARSGVRS
jgi:hypothetical protein